MGRIKQPGICYISARSGSCGAEHKGGAVSFCRWPRGGRGDLANRQAFSSCTTNGHISVCHAYLCTWIAFLVSDHPCRCATFPFLQYILGLLCSAAIFLTVELVFLYPYGRVLYLDLPKLGCRKHVRVVLVSTGSFNPPTYMHLRMFGLPPLLLPTCLYFLPPIFFVANVLL
jgi:hypothetical protein